MLWAAIKMREHFATKKKLWKCFEGPYIGARMALGRPYSQFAKLWTQSSFLHGNFYQQSDINYSRFTTEISKLSFLILPKSDVWVLTVAHCVLKRNPDGSYSSRQISHEHFQIFHNVKNGYNLKTSSFRKTFKSVFNSSLYSMFVIKDINIIQLMNLLIEMLNNIESKKFL